MDLWAMAAIALLVFYGNYMVAPLLPAFSREFAVGARACSSNEIWILQRPRTIVRATLSARLIRPSLHYARGKMRKTWFNDAFSERSQI